MTTFSLFNRVFSDYSEKTAIITSDGTELTYNQVRERASQLANLMERQDIKKDDLVAILMDRDTDYLIAMAACLLYGYAFIPMDTEYPKERIEMILSDSKAAFVIDNSVFAQSANEKPIKKTKRTEPGKNDPCYVVYTSGSTGRPKGILHDQQSFYESVTRNAKVVDLNEKDIWGATAPFTFVAMTFEVPTTWVNSAAVRIIPRNIVKDPDLLASYIWEKKITASFIPPRSLRLFKVKGNSLRLVISGGEKLNHLVPESYRLLEVYGQSETCGACVWLDIKKDYDETPIGKPVKGNGLYLLDENGKEASEGEICITGHFMTGYINMPESTASTIEANPFDDGYEQLIHTGDLGKKLENGDIVFVNRKDWMIKINGQRVEPGEIEVALKSVEGVSEVAVKSFVNRYEQTYICAYYTSEKKLEGDRLRSKLQEKLPSYMVPSFFIQLDALPLNSNRKLDRGALKEPDTSAFLSEYVEPSNETEAAICKAFSKVLGLPKVGILDDFFRLGGDSIKSVMVCKQCPDCNLSVKHIFNGKTPQKIAGLVLEENSNEAWEVRESDTMPLTDSQMAVFLDCCSDKPDCRYNLPFVFSFPKSAVSSQVLKDALLATWKNHQAFSLEITTIQGNPVMAKNKTQYPEVPVISASEEEFQKIKTSFVVPFNVGKECLYRAKIVETENYVNLLFDIHHLIFDGTSLEVFEKDLCDACSCKQLEPEAITPFMVSAFEQTQTRQKEKKECLEFYKNYLSDCETDSNLNPDVNLADFSLSKGMYEASVNLDARAVEFFTQNAGVTENTLFASAFAYALAKFTCQNQTLFVSGENGRPRADMDRTVGMFVRTFPVFVGVDEEQRTVDFLRAVQNSYFDAMTHDAVPFADIVNACELDTGVKFVYQSEILNGFDFNGAKVKTENLPVDSAMSNLEMMVMKQNGGYKVALGYRKSMYSQELIESFVDSYIMIADGMVKSVYLKDIKLVNEKQKTLLDGFNSTEYEYDSSKTAVDLFKQAVASYPDNKAVVFKNREMSYREVDRLTDNLASYIVSQNIEKDSFVAIMTSRTILMPVICYGVLKAGCAYQPLDPSYPSDRLNFMVNDSNTPLLIVERELYSLIKDFKGKVLFTDQIESLPDGKVNVSLAPQNRLVLLYTSGTTGLPKGVVITHKNVVNLVLNHKLNFDYSSESRCAAYASFGFDAYVMDMFTTLSMGACLYIVPEEIRLDLNAIKDFYVKNRISHGFVTTQLGCMLAQAIKTKDLKCLMLGGEKIIPFTPSDDFKVLNGYGPSECVAYVSQYRVKDDSPIQPIGKANRNTKLYIADKYLRRMPVGSCGELLIAGPQVSNGYLNRPDKTQEVFIANPYCSSEDYSRVYRTGDITRILPDGNLEFIGRRDGQVKIRGFRIELTEVEKVIRAFDGIVNATVQAYDDPNGGKFLAAFIVSDTKIDVEKLNSFIESEKPSYMVPAVTIQLDEIPYNQNSKVDKRRLPKPEMKAQEIIKPKNRMQEEILDLVSTVLGTGQIGITTDFFRAGLSSLGTIRLNALLSDTFEVVIQTRDLKANPTVEKLEKFISDSKPNQDKQEEPSVVYPDYPLSKTQEGIFIECQGNLSSTVYNIPYLLKINKDIDIRRLKLAICEAVEAHNYINTTLFYDASGNIRQKLAPIGSFSADEVEVIKTDDFESIKSKLVAPHNLVGGRLFRIAVIESSDNYLFLDFHHIISDGTSMTIFVKDIEDAYLGNSPKQEKYTGYDVALNEQKLLNSPVYLDAEDYYNNLLNGVDTGFLPHSDMHSYAQKGSGKLVALGQSGTVSKLESYCKKNNVSENSVLCTVFGYVLALYNGCDTSLFTTVYNGRNDSRMGRTISMLVKTLPVLFSPESSDVLSNIRKMSQQLVDNMANDIYSFAEISRKFSIKADVMFIFQGKGFEQTSFCNKDCSVVSLDLSDAKAPLAIQVVERGDRLEYSIECDPDSYTDDFAHCLFKALDKAVSDITEVSAFEELSLTDEETAFELDKINSKEVPYDKNRNVVVSLKENVKKSPDRVAVSFKDKTYTYRQFDEITDSLAYYLKSHGVTRKSYVAILLDRSHFMPVSAWGVIKAQAAYVPIDPTYPKDRIKLMLDDSQAGILITERDKKDLFESYQGTVLYTDEMEKLPKKEIKETILEEDPFILIYSSGSTGTPKGSMLPHRSLTSLLFAHSRRFNILPGSRIGSYASFGFDAGLMDIFCPLVCDSSLFIIPEEIRLDIPALEDFFVKNEINYSFMTTQVARLFLLNTKCKSLKAFIFGGEKMQQFVPPKGMEICNGYGPSESNNYVTLFGISDDNPVQPIGYQSINTKLYVVDKTGKRLPPYACGELCIAGPQVALGYLNRPEKTAQSFVRNPFSDDKDYSVLYKTGDIVRMFRHGEYDFVGRRDGQVKIRGFRIELGEIEHIINEYPGVKQVTAQVFDDPNGGKFIAAYYVGQSEINPQDLAAFIKQSKPSYMVPAFMAQVDSIPLTSNGKVNKAKLPSPKLSSKKEGAEPVGETEAKLCELFAATLNTNKVYADDDFFELGGTSLSALQLVVKCVNAGFMVVYKNLFENRSPRDLARLLEGKSSQQDVFAPTGKEAEKYDYSALDYNVIENLDKIKNEGVGDVLLTGPTGFLGVHTLKYLLDSTDSNVICLIRPKKDISAEQRLVMTYGYYFSEYLTDYLGTRVKVVEGQLSDANLYDKLGNYKFDTIINCAANVHHFGTEEALMRDNFQGIDTLIKVAMSRNARLVQTSSISVCGESIDGHISNDFRFKENNLNIGQSLENMYVRSKFMAEQAIIDAISKGLRGKIVRFGNLMARNIDGEFQMNSSNSGFLKMLNGFRILGCYPIDCLDSSVEFSPIDCAAKALVLLSGTPDEFTVFHADNSHAVHFANILETMNKVGFKIDYVNPAVFAQRFSECSHDESLASSLSGLLSYLNNAKGSVSGIVKKNTEIDKDEVETRIKIGHDSSFTVKALYRLGFSWPLTDMDYLISLIKNMKGLDFFK